MQKRERERQTEKPDVHSFLIEKQKKKYISECVDDLCHKLEKHNASHKYGCYKNYKRISKYFSK